MNQNLNERLDLLYETSQISQETYQLIPKLLVKVEKDLHVSLSEENAGQFVSHLSIAIERIRKNEGIKSAPPEVMKLTIEYPELYAFANELMKLAIEEKSLDTQAEAAFVTLYYCLLTKKEEME